MSCDVCGGRGWVPPPANVEGAWPAACPVCARKARLDALNRTVALATELDVHRRDIYRVRTMKAGRRVSARILFALAEKVPEAFE